MTNTLLLTDTQLDNLAYIRPRLQAAYIRLRHVEGSDEQTKEQSDMIDALIIIDDILTSAGRRPMHYTKLSSWEQEHLFRPLERTNPDVVKHLTYPSDTSNTKC